MYRNRIIPCLLLNENKLVKTTKFKNPKYLGDPLNAVKIFNDKCVDELIFIDISATKNKKINFKLLEKIANQSFMPLGYAGGINNFDDAAKIFKLGFEKICLNNSLFTNPNLITKISNTYGSQSVVVCIDVKKNIFGKYQIYNYLTNKTHNNLLEWAKNAEKLGCGEIIINSVDNDGVMKGYDPKLIKLISENLNIPVVALGGAGKLQDLQEIIKHGASAAAAGSLFVYYGPHKAVLINYPGENEL